MSSNAICCSVVHLNLIVEVVFMEIINYFGQNFNLFKVNGIDELPLEYMYSLIGARVGHGGHSLRDIVNDLEDKTICYGEVNVNVFKKAIEAYPGYPNTFDSFIGGYLKCDDIPDYGESKWAVIICFDEVIFDGWHRFASYVNI